MDVSQTVRISVFPEGPVSKAHPILHEHRALSASDVSDFTIDTDVWLEGPIPPASVAESERRLVEVELAKVNARFERVTSQQYLKLSTARRDVTYEMCGTQGKVVLSGKRLVGAMTPEATKPIRRRVTFWFLLVATVAGLAAWLRLSFLPDGTYFEAARLLATCAAACACVVSIPLFGALLRNWRPGLRLRRPGTGTWVSLAFVGCALGAIPIVGVKSWPEASDAVAALERNDVGRARAIVDALDVRDGAVVDELDDRVSLAEAGGLAGAAKLDLLDKVASHASPVASDAKAQARTERIAEVGALLDAKDSVHALAILDHSLPGNDPVVAEERARAHETAVLTCASEPCRLAELAGC
jgi:hypothetical protein